MQLDKIMLQLPKMQCESDKNGENGTKILEYFWR